MGNTKDNLKKCPKESLKNILQQSKEHVKKFLVLGILGFLFIHKCALNVGLELLQNFS